MVKPEIAFYYTELFERESQKKATELMVDFWRETARSYGITTLIMIDTSPGKSARGIKGYGKTFTVMDSLHEVGEYVYEQQRNLVILTPGQGIPLSEYQHPTERALYLFGPDNPESFREDWLDGDRVHIVLPKPYPLWSSVAAGIVLNDRFVKQG